MRDRLTSKDLFVVALNFSGWHFVSSNCFFIFLRFEGRRCRNGCNSEVTVCYDWGNAFWQFY